MINNNQSLSYIEFHQQIENDIKTKNSGNNFSKRKFVIKYTIEENGIEYEREICVGYYKSCKKHMKAFEKHFDRVAREQNQGLSTPIYHLIDVEAIKDAKILKSMSSTLAKGIEKLVIKQKNTNNILGKISLWALSRIISVTVFPIILTIELSFVRIPDAVFAIPILHRTPENKAAFSRKTGKIKKFTLGIILSPLGLKSPDAVAGPFLKVRPSTKVIRPFGVEKEYGAQVNSIYYPTSTAELQALVKKGAADSLQISIVGAGLSQGPQTVPFNNESMVINTKFINSIEISEEQNTVKIGSGANWEQVQIELNKVGKSVIVKQAADVFSIGGSIGINCHGWAHKHGAIASTVTSLEVINAEGELVTINQSDELFGCMFGTLGYFGIIVSATFQIVENEKLIKQTREIDLVNFLQEYEGIESEEKISLFRGRLNFDMSLEKPFEKVTMISYEKVVEEDEHKPIITEPFKPEQKNGKAIERFGLRVVNHAPKKARKKFISYFNRKDKEQILSENNNHTTRNEVLHRPFNALKILHHSSLHSQWLQEYFVKPENLVKFLNHLGAVLKENKVEVINATIRPTPIDNISVLPYAEQNRFAIVICFKQLKTKKKIERTKNWIQNINKWLLENNDIFYQAYTPYSTKEEFEQCYGKNRIEAMRQLKQKYDPNNRFGNGHTRKYFDQSEDGDS